MVVVVLTIGVSNGPASAVPLAAPRRLHLERTIRTTPFAHTKVSMRDSEGSAYVPRDRSLWLADDNGRRVYEVNPATGGLKRVIGRKRFESARRFGGGSLAGTDRTLDLESVAYDRAHDALYVFSGSCCSPPVKPTVFRLKRNARGNLYVESFQPLGSAANYTAAAWNAKNGKIYVAHGRDLRAFNYATNTVGRAFRVPNLTGITGMSFTPDGANLFVTTDSEKLRRVRWSTKRLVAGWTFDLRQFGIHDARAVELIGGRYYVSDGNDARSTADPRRYAVYVFTVS
jgi:hypothetical protein